MKSSGLYVESLTWKPATEAMITNITRAEDNIEVSSIKSDKHSKAGGQLVRNHVSPDSGITIVRSKPLLQFIVKKVETCQGEGSDAWRHHQK